MDHNQAREILKQIESSGLTSLRRELLRKAFDYAHIRANWYLLDPEEQTAMDQNRSLAHNALIDACNILSRNMAKVGEDNSWRAELGDERKRIGDFACWVHAIIGVRMA